MKKYLTNCSDTELKDLYNQVNELNKNGNTDAQPLRRFIDETPNGLFVVPFVIFQEISKRWNKDLIDDNDTNFVVILKNEEGKFLSVKKLKSLPAAKAYVSSSALREATSEPDYPAETSIHNNYAKCFRSENDYYEWFIEPISDEVIEPDIYLIKEEIEYRGVREFSILHACCSEESAKKAMEEIVTNDDQWKASPNKQLDLDSWYACTTNEDFTDENWTEWVIKKVTLSN